MIRQLGPLTFFFTFLFIEKLWNVLIKVLHTLHASRLNLPNKIEDLKYVHIIELIRIDLVTCARYYDHRTSCFHKLIAKYHYLFGYILDFFFIIEFQNHGNEHDHGFLWIKNAPMYGVHTNEEIEQFINTYISYDVSLSPNPLQNAQ
jgi:hypothetical protein